MLNNDPLSYGTLIPAISKNGSNSQAILGESYRLSSELVVFLHSTRAIGYSRSVELPLLAGHLCDKLILRS